MLKNLLLLVTEASTVAHARVRFNKLLKQMERKTFIGAGTFICEEEPVISPHDFIEDYRQERFISKGIDPRARLTHDDIDSLEKRIKGLTFFESNKRYFAWVLGSVENSHLFAESKQKAVRNKRGMHVERHQATWILSVM